MLDPRTDGFLSVRAAGPLSRRRAAKRRAQSPRSDGAAAASASRPPGEHHVCGRRAPAGQFRGQPNPPRVRGDPALDAGGLCRRREPQLDHLRRQRNHAVARLRDSWRHVACGGRAPRRPSRTGCRSRRPPGSSCCDTHGDQHAVPVSRLDDVGPAQRAHLAPRHPGHEQQPGDQPRRDAPVPQPTRQTRRCGRAAAAGGR